jgi:hypothetical protein
MRIGSGRGSDASSETETEVAEEVRVVDGGEVFGLILIDNEDREDRSVRL